MRIPIFLSYPKPHLKEQKTFINRMKAYLRERGFLPRTLGVTDYDTEAPLKAIRRVMLESNGFITVAFRRTYISEGTLKLKADIPSEEENEAPFCKVWLTSPYCQIEPAMAYQLGLPILILREKGVCQEGILEKGVVGTYMPEFSLDKKAPDYLKSRQWKDLIGQWEGYVRSVVKNKGNPPTLF